jgi:hypothetical protein
MTTELMWEWDGECSSCGVVYGLDEGCQPPDTKEAALCHACVWNAFEAQRGLITTLETNLAQERAKVKDLEAQLGQAHTQRPVVVAKTVWGYATSDDCDTWSGMCETREQAIKEARSEFGDVPYFYVMEGTQSPPSAYVPDANWVVEQMAETADGGEASAEFPEVSDEAKKELDELLEAWADRNVKVNFWVADVAAERIEQDEDPATGS